MDQRGRKAEEGIVYRSVEQMVSLVSDTGNSSVETPIKIN